MTSDTTRPRRTQAERSATTRAALLRSARALFGEKGFAATGREEIVEAAGVTRGALYHHFANKADLFRAVYEELEQEVLARVYEAAVQTPDPLDQLKLGTSAYLDAAMDRAVQQICLLDAPSVLDWEARQEIAESSGLGMVREVLRAAMDAGTVEPGPVDPMARMLLAALHEAALYMARAPDQQAARADVGITVERMLGRL